MSEKTVKYGNEIFSIEEEGQDKRTAALEILRQKLTGWSKLLAPFLIQNMGWFISTFLFVAGSVFVVACTEGLVKTLIIAISLFAYTIILAFGAYQMQRRRPDLHTTAEVLATLAMLLIPLSILSSSRLFAGTVESGLFAGFIMAGLNLTFFHVTAKILSGIMDPSLGGRHAKIFLIFSATQLGAPFIAHYRIWPLLALFHSSLLALLGFVLIRQSGEWFTRLFVERRRMAFYAMGTIVYSAFVSFMHMTWLYEGDLPSGYYGPFLMVLTGLLFYIDSSFKELTKRYTFLSKLNFVLYGLSIVAIAMTIGSAGAKIITLAIGAILYGMVLRNYLTAVPLYLMLGCLGWLYGILVLEDIPKAVHFIASLPAMAGLFELHRRLSLRGAHTLAGNSFCLLLVSFFVLAAWSLIGITPSLITFTTASLISGLTYGIVRFAPLYVFNALPLKADFLLKILDTEQDPRDTVLFYLVPFSLLLTLIYTPLVLKAGSGWQFAMGLLLLANLWAAMGMKAFNRRCNIISPRAIYLTNSALTGIAISLAIVLFQGPAAGNPYLHLALLISGGIIISIAILFGMRALLYGGMFLATAGIVLLRRTYIPWPSTGMLEMVAVICTWGGLKYLEQSKSAKLHRHICLEKNQNLKLVWFLPLKGLSPYETIRPTLRQVVPVLSLISITLTCRYLLLHGFTMPWVVSAGLATLSVMILLAYYKQLRFWPVPLVMGLGTVIGFSHSLGFTSVMQTSSVAAIYALFTWMVASQLSKHPLLKWFAGPAVTGTKPEFCRKLIEKTSYRTSYALSLIAICMSFLSWAISTDATAIITILTGTAFFQLSGRRYRQRINSYIVLFGGITTAIIIYCKLLILQPEALFIDAPAGIIWPVLALSLRVIAKAINPGSLGERLYAKPMREAAIVLALIGPVFQIIPINTEAIRVSDIIILALSSLVIILAGHRPANAVINLAGMAIATLTILNLQSFLFEEGLRLNLWPDSGGPWLTASLLALTGAVASAKLDNNERRKLLYGRSLRLIAGACYVWVCFRLMPLIGAGLAAHSVPAYSPLLFLIQGVTLFPLLRNFSEGKTIRGAGLSFLLTGFAATALPFMGIPWNGATIYLWALVLWATSSYAIPLFNRPYPQLALSPSLWPCVGLALVAVIYPTMIARGDLILNWLYWFGTSVYLFMFLGKKGSFIIYRFAVAFLVFSGISLAGNFNLRAEEFLAASLLWTNLLFFISRGIKRFDHQITEHFNWQSGRVSSPFLGWGKLLTSMAIATLIFIDLLLLIVGSVSMNDLRDIFPFVGLLIFASIQLYALEKTRWNAQRMLLAIFLTTLLVLTVLYVPLTHLSLLLAAWGALPAIAGYLLSKDVNRGNQLSSLLKAMNDWTKYLPWLSLIALLAFPIASLRESILILTLVTVTVAAHGWKKGSEKVIFRARILGLLLLHTWPLLFLPPGKASGLYLYQVWPIVCAQFERLQVLFPWYALQLTIVMLVLIRVRTRLSDSAKETWPQLAGLLGKPSIEISLALSFLALHFATFIQSLNPMPQANAWIHGIAAFLSGAILIATGLKKTIGRGESRYVYGLFLIAGVMGLYVRLLIMGLTPLTLWDTAALVALAYGFFFLEEVVKLPILSKALGQASVFLPLLALFTVPMQTASPSAASVLLAAGTLYLTRHFVSGEKLMLYMGVATINAAIYLWIPVWAAKSNAMQLYTVPAALSVLVLLQLHRGELKASILNNVRLAALCVLYASSSVDIFLRPEFWIFALFLFLALSGVAAGIMFRIKVFLYSSVAFLVINVLAQLLRFYPEEGLGKGILLMVCGSVIMGGMVWFNVKRESIMKKVRIYRADLARWE